MMTKTAAAVVSLCLGAASVWAANRCLTDLSRPDLALRVKVDASAGSPRLQLLFVNLGEREVRVAPADSVFVKPPARKGPYTLYLRRTGTEGGAPVVLAAKGVLRVDDLTPVLAGLPAGDIRFSVVYQADAAAAVSGAWSGFLQSNTVKYF